MATRTTLLPAQECAPVSTARDEEASIWRRIVGLDDDEPMVQQIRAIIDERLRRREENLREAEQSLA